MAAGRQPDTSGEQKNSVQDQIEDSIKKGRDSDLEKKFDASEKHYERAVKLAMDHQHPLLSTAQLLEKTATKNKYIQIHLQNYMNTIVTQFKSNSVEYLANMAKITEYRDALALEFDATDLFVRDVDIPKAIRLIHEALQLFPSTSLYLLLGRCHDRQGDMNNAILSYEKSIKIIAYPKVYFFKGITLAKFNMLEEAREAFLTGMNLDEEHRILASLEADIFWDSWVKCEKNNQSGLIAKLENYQLRSNRPRPSEYLPHIIDVTIYSNLLLEENTTTGSFTNPKYFHCRAQSLAELGLYQEAIDDLIITEWTTRIQSEGVDVSRIADCVLKRRYLYIQMDDLTGASVENAKFVAYIRDMTAEQLNQISWVRQHVRSKKVDLTKDNDELMYDLVELTNLELSEDMLGRIKQLKNNNQIFLIYCGILGVLHAAMPRHKYVSLEPQTKELVMRYDKQEQFLAKSNEEKDESGLLMQIKTLSEILSPIITAEGKIIPLPVPEVERRNKAKERREKLKKKQGANRSNKPEFSILPATADKTVEKIVEQVVEQIIKKIEGQAIGQIVEQIIEQIEEQTPIPKDQEENQPANKRINESDSPPPYSPSKPAEAELKEGDAVSENSLTPRTKPKTHHRRPRYDKMIKKKIKKPKKSKSRKEESESSVSEDDSFVDQDVHAPDPVVESNVSDEKEKEEKKQLSPCQKAFSNMPAPIKKFEISPFLSWCMKSLLDASQDPQTIVLCSGGYVRKLLSDAKYDTDGDGLGNVSEEVIHKVFGGMADIMKGTKGFGELYTIIFHKDVQFPHQISFKDGVEYQKGEKVVNGLNEAKFQFTRSKILCDESKPPVLRMSLAAESANFTMNAGLIDWMGYVYAFLPTTLTDIEKKIIRTSGLPQTQTGCQNGRIQILQAVYYREKTGFEIHGKFKKIVKNITPDVFKDLPAEDLNAFIKKVSKSGMLLPFYQSLLEQKLFSAFFPLVGTILKDDDYKAVFEQEIKNIDALPIYKRSHNYMYLLIVICTAPKESVLQSCNGKEEPVSNELLSYISIQIKQNKYFEANFRDCPARIMARLTYDIVMKLKEVLTAKQTRASWRANISSPMRPPFFQQSATQASFVRDETMPTTAKYHSPKPES